MAATARGYQVHVIRAGSEGERRTLAFRDELRRDPETARAYEAVKRELTERFAQDVMAYTEAKTPFIRDVERQAIGQT